MPYDDTPAVTDDELRELEDRFQAAYRANDALLDAISTLKEANERLVAMNQELIDENIRLKLSIGIQEAIADA